jgi:hypothetical protein
MSYYHPPLPPDRFMIKLAILLALIVTAVLCAGRLPGQTTRVIPLEKSDAELIKARYDAMKSAEAEFEKADKWVKKKYGGKPESENEVEGFEYSVDFQFLLKPAADKKYSYIIGAATQFLGVSDFTWSAPPKN